MAGDATQLEAGHAPDAGGKVRLLTLDALDGRTAAAKRVRQVEAQIIADLGGDQAASEMQRALARRAAVLAAVLEDAEARWAGGRVFDLDAYLPAVNAHRRLAATLGLQRVARRIPGRDRLAELLAD